MAEKILFVVEGAKSEPEFFKNIQKTFFSNKNGASILVAYEGNIYEFWNKIKEDVDDFEMLELIKERGSKNRKALNGIYPSDIAEIYFFFDYDGHATCADDIILKEIVDFFDNETEQGKIFVSYPMAEALKEM